MVVFGYLWDMMFFWFEVSIVQKECLWKGQGGVVVVELIEIGFVFGIVFFYVQWCWFIFVVVVVFFD